MLNEDNSSSTGSEENLPNQPTSQNDLAFQGQALEPQNENKNPLKESRHLIRAFLFGFLFVVILAAIGGAYFLGINKSANKSQQTASTQVSAPSPTWGSLISEIVDIDSLTSKYINHEYKFSVTFPKYNKGSYSCEILKNPNYSGYNNGQTPLKIFEDMSDNSIYISEATTPEVGSKQLPNGGWTGDYDKCKIVNNSLSLIKNGYDNGTPAIPETDSNITRPVSFQIWYSRAENDDDLNNFLHKHYGKNCVVYQKIANQRMQGILDVKFQDISGKNSPPDSNDNIKCWINFAYHFYFNPETKTAVLTSGQQEAAFNGTNGQMNPKYELFN